MPDNNHSQTFYGLKSLGGYEKCPMCGRGKNKWEINPFRILRSIAGLILVVLLIAGIIKQPSEQLFYVSLAGAFLLIDRKLPADLQKRGK